MPGVEDSKTLYGYETLRGNPPPTDKPMRLISMEYCPFAERARIVLAKKGLEHDIVNVSLSNKPQFLLDGNPNGQVPVLLHNGRPFYESEIVVEYLEQAFPETATLYPKDAGTRADARILSSQHGGKIIPQFYKVLGAYKTGEQEKIDEALAGFRKAVDTWAEKKLGDSPFFGGETANITDILIWPWIYRAEILSRLNKIPYLPADQFPKVYGYVQAMRQLPYIQATASTDKNFIAFVESYQAGKKPSPFNIGSTIPFYAGPIEKDDA